METWQDIQNEIIAAGALKGIPGDFDLVRRDAYQRLSALTGRPLIVYASAFHLPYKAQLAGPMLSLDLNDKEGFQEVVRKLEGPSVDILIHSPGGSAEATESIVSIIRSKFDDVRFIVTGSAKSAAAMLALSGNMLLMTDAAELGPTDPQISLGNYKPAPARAVLEQFDLAKREIAKNPQAIGPWLPILQQLGPSFLVECNNHIRLAETLLAEWLEKFMFHDEKLAKARAKNLARFLANDRNFLSHGRRVDIALLREHGAKVGRVEDLAPEIQKAINRVHLTIMVTLDSTAAVKLIENSVGTALIQLMQPGPLNLPFQQTLMSLPGPS